MGTKGSWAVALAAGTCALTSADRLVMVLNVVPEPQAATATPTVRTPPNAKLRRSRRPRAEALAT